jgi:cytoskeleton protein RodZ
VSRKKKKPAAGTDKRKLVLEESLFAGHEAPRTAAEEAVSHADMNSNAYVGSEEPEIQASDRSSEAAEPADAPRAPAAVGVETPHGSLGQRLRAAREAKGWSTGEVGSRLHIPVQIIQQIEAEQYEKIGYGIYLRGYLTSYARLVDVPTILIDPVLRERSDAPPLVASGTISHSRYLYQRYSVSALYLILTGVIIVPAVLLAMRASMQPPAPQLATLEAPATTAAPGVATVDAATHAGGEATMPPAATPASAAPSGSDAPLVASLAPFPPLHKDNPAAAHAEAAPVSSGAHSLKLSLKEASWVEVQSATGEKLEYGLLPAGSVRSYSSDKPLEVRLGNCNGAEIEADGQSQDLAPYRRANVAHFRLFSAGQTISRTDS